MNQPTCLLLLILLGTPALAYRSCSNPTSNYGSFVQSNRAFPCSDGTTAQCVSVIYHFCSVPTNVNTKKWIRGTKVSSVCSSLPINTAIASFQGSGGTKYDGNDGHAAIFRGCEQSGIRVADQYCGKATKFSERVLPFHCPAGQRKPASNCADYFYTIEW